MRTVPSVLAFVVALSAVSYADDCAGCKTAMVKGGWCEPCKEGFVSGVNIKSKKLYDALSGMEMKPDAMKCDGCKAAAAKGGECAACHVSFAHGKAYKSKIAAKLAAGDALDPAKVSCDGCKKVAADHGWCDACKVGLVGYHAYKDRAAYDDAAKARATLVNASSAAGKCEACAVAMVTDGKCETCKMSFKDGKASPG